MLCSTESHNLCVIVSNLVQRSVHSANRPEFTTIPHVVPPSNQAYQLASKNVNIKNFAKELSSIIIQDDKLATIFSVFSRIAQCVDIACTTSALLPSISAQTVIPDFYALLVPKNTHTFFHGIHNSYLSLSTGLYNYFTTPETIGTSAIKVAQAFKEVRMHHDGFFILANILHKLLPQFGGSPVSTTDILSDLVISSGIFQR